MKLSASVNLKVTEGAILPLVHIYPNSTTSLKIKVDAIFGDPKYVYLLHGDKKTTFTIGKYIVDKNDPTKKFRIFLKDPKTGERPKENGKFLDPDSGLYITDDMNGYIIKVVEIETEPALPLAG
jgi:hypothetical protein